MRHLAAARGVASLLAVVLTLAGCSVTQTEDDNEGDRAQPPARTTGSPEPTPTPTAGQSDGPAAARTRDRMPDPADAVAGGGVRPVIEPVSDRQWRRMVATEVWRPECPVDRSDLRRVRVSYLDFDGRVRRGTLVVNRDVATSIARIFTQLFEQRFTIRRMWPVEAYGGDVNASLAADNTAAYNCRQPDQINAPVLESPHANGRAIDINPRENPWVDLRCDCWLPSPDNRRRVPGRGVILRGGPVWRLFRDEGWLWQNIDVPDYMHFDTGYPSRPYRGPEANKRWHERQQRRERRLQAQD